MALALLGAAPAAQSEGFALNRFQPADDPGGFFTVSSPSVSGDRRLSAALVAEYAHEPLVLRTVDGSQRADVVSGQLHLHATFAYALWHRLLVSLAVPFAASNTGQDVMPPDGPTLRAPSGAALGDLSVGGRLRLMGDGSSPVALALGARLWVPSGQRAAYTGDGKLRGAVDLAVGGRAGQIVWSAASGWTLRGRNQLHDMVSDDEVQIAAALGYRLARDRLQIGPEVVATLMPWGQLDGGGSAVGQLLLSARYQPGPMFVALAAGPGLGRAIGAPAVRLLARVGYAPPLAAASKMPPAATALSTIPPAPRPAAPGSTPAAPAAATDAEGDADPDGDGIASRDDRCPRERGEPTGDPGSHGCPSLVRVTEQQIITLKNVHFVSGMARLHPDASELLAQIAQVLNEHPEIRRIAVEGHTDGRGRRARNQRLSMARAASVKRWLVAHGIAPQRVESRGFGASRPVASDDTEEGRERNRRVEFRIVDPAPLDLSAAEPPALSP